MSTRSFDNILSELKSFQFQIKTHFKIIKKPSVSNTFLCICQTNYFKITLLYYLAEKSEIIKYYGRDILKNRQIILSL